MTWPAEDKWPVIRPEISGVERENNMEQVKLGIIGIGNMGSGHCRTILDGQVPELKLVAVADLRETRITPGW